ncbi:MAG TPA: SRPBCC family protein [Acidimicrobiales bacterium]|nr:SRPBCC family protein [Acidimicrobiales bacterium]
MVEPAAGVAGVPGRWRFEVVAHSAAPPSVLWPLLGEAEQWKRWSFLTRSFLLRPGAPEPDGVGALRRFAVGPFGSSEEVVAFEPPVHLGYVAHKGLPVRSYRADVVLSEDGDHTVVTWTGSLEPVVPGTGALVLRYARTFVRRFSRQLVAYADRLAGEAHRP